MKNKIFKKYISLAAMIVFLTAMTGCGSSEQKFDYDNKADVADVKEQTLSLGQMNYLSMPNKVQMSLSRTYDIETLKSEGIVEIVRFNKGRYYSVTPLENDKYLFLLYSDGVFSGNDSIYVVDGYLTSCFANKDDFEDIHKGMNRDDILSKDPNAYVFSQYSCHRFSDKSILEVEYDTTESNQYIVSDYCYYYPAECEHDPPVESVVDYMLPKDIKLIS